MIRQLLHSRTWLHTGLAIALMAAPALAQVVINEIDYDQPSTDSSEFIELKNVGSADVNLSSYSLDLVNGNGTTVYASIALPDVVLAAGEYFVICANASTTPSCDLDVSPDTNLIQNGSPDAVALLLNGNIVDTVSYEGDTGAPYTEGSGVGLEDVAVADAGISRYPDGTDTDQNNVDFSFRCISPGAPNVALDSNCDQGLAVEQSTWRDVKVLYR
jgi:hypothetical protein